MCDHDFFGTDYNTHICMNCGLEKTIPIVSRPLPYTLNQPLWVGYSRVNRFRKINKQLFYPTSYGHIAGEIFVQMKKAGKFDTTEIMVNYLKTLISKSKNYNALHLYAVNFVKDYTPLEPPMKYIQEGILADFALLEMGMHITFPGKRFFSYRWVLIKLLKIYRLFQYVPFVKPLVNKNSSHKYENMFNSIMTVNKHEKVQESPPVIETQLVQLPDDDSESQALGYALLRLLKSDPRSYKLVGCYPTERS